MPPIVTVGMATVSYSGLPLAAATAPVGSILPFGSPPGVARPNPVTKICNASPTCAGCAQVTAELKFAQSVRMPIAVAIDVGIAIHALLATSAAAFRRVGTVGSVKKNIPGTDDARLTVNTSLWPLGSLIVTSTVPLVGSSFGATTLIWPSTVASANTGAAVFPNITDVPFTLVAG